MCNGTAVSRFVALNEDGTISSSYAYPAFDGEVLDVCILPMVVSLCMDHSATQ